jgi:hypothetical protein
LTKEEVAAKVGYEANGGGFNNALGRLRTLELVQRRGELRASDICSMRPDNVIDSIVSAFCFCHESML